MRFLFLSHHRQFGITLKTTANNHASINPLETFLIKCNLKLGDQCELVNDSGKYYIVNSKTKNLCFQVNVSGRQCDVCAMIIRSTASSCVHCGYDVCPKCELERGMRTRNHNCDKYNPQNFKAEVSVNSANW